MTTTKQSGRTVPSYHLYVLHWKSSLKVWIWTLTKTEAWHQNPLTVLPSSWSLLSHYHSEADIDAKSAAFIRGEQIPEVKPSAWLQSCSTMLPFRRLVSDWSHAVSCRQDWWAGGGIWIRAQSVSAWDFATWLLEVNYSFPMLHSYLCRVVQLNTRFPSGRLEFSKDSSEGAYDQVTSSWPWTLNRSYILLNICPWRKCVLWAVLSRERGNTGKPAHVS